MNFDSANDGIALLGSDINAHMVSDFEFKYWITVKGKADIVITKMAIEIEVDLSTQPVGEEKGLKLKSQKVDIQL